MALIEWDDSMSVGDSAIDREHRMLIRDVNNMDCAWGAGRGKKTIDRIIAKLLKDAEEHFRREELWLKPSSEVDFDGHKREHLDLLYALRKFRNKYDKEPALLSLGATNFLVLWLMHHILELDRPAAAAIGLVDAPSNQTFDWSVIEEAGSVYGLNLVRPCRSSHQAKFSHSSLLSQHQLCVPAKNRRKSSPNRRKSCPNRRKKLGQQLTGR